MNLCLRRSTRTGLIALVLAALPGPANAELNEQLAAAVVDQYADIAHAAFEDSLNKARSLQRTIEALIAEPSGKTMKRARNAWLAARKPYMQTEVYRFGNPIVDEWEGKVNARSLDEGLIDYVAEGYGTESAENPVYAANVIASESLKMGGETIDASNITRELLGDPLHELGGVEANVVTGYHAIEFLLWGQNLNGTVPAEWPGNGRRILVTQSRLVFTAPCHPIEAPCPG